MLSEADILVTGGAGTLGRAIARRRKEQGWEGRFTVYSTNPEHHQKMRRNYPDVQYIQGDIRNPDTMYNAIVGHDVVIHAAAVKYIPDAEYASLDTMDVNYEGSLVVAQVCVRANVEHVLAISTDKACHPANLYGASKMAMEKAWWEYARAGFDTQFHLVRYGNVIESTGSVIEAWRKAAAGGDPVYVTDPEMTRFWLSPSQAVDLVEDAFAWNSGLNLVAKMPALSVGKMLEYIVGENYHDVRRIPLRPGEKMHETLLTVEELAYAQVTNSDGDFILGPTTGMKVPEEDRWQTPYSSDVARELSKEELLELLEDKPRKNAEELENRCIAVHWHTTARCTLEKGHTGKHLGTDDVEF